MESMLDLFLHVDVKLREIIALYGSWTYVILGLVVFCETGLVIMPFLPGDSLLFAAGALAAAHDLSLMALWIILVVAAIVGDTVNYWVGGHIGERLLKNGTRFIRQEHIDRTKAFYEEHGGKTIILARFMPIIRTFAPFVAGMSRMSYVHFFLFNVVGALLWVSIFLFGGYLLGNVSAVKEHFEFIIVGIIIFSFMPAIIRFIQSRRSVSSES